MDLEAMLADQISKAVAGAIPADAANKSDVQAAVDALKAELPELIKAAVAAATPIDRQGVGSHNTVGGETPVTLDSDPAAYLLQKSTTIKDVDEWTPTEKAVINGIFNRYMTQGMVSLSNEAE